MEITIHAVVFFLAHSTQGVMLSFAIIGSLSVCCLYFFSSFSSETSGCYERKLYRNDV